ncbi:hypothetical protein C8F04DRAFT_1085646 [Mycena alexandri]|uniref:Uncharacterized protein n=1 Tax=Mycena alexandri TaxID=1745969 RepID=A0AAD6T4A4_9AGAR|nr:hypothetical protein C8F04DRAFT_1085646 [Mycena alexandri]
MMVGTDRPNSGLNSTALWRPLVLTSLDSWAPIPDAKTETQPVGERHVSPQKTADVEDGEICERVEPALASSDPPYSSTRSLECDNCTDRCRGACDLTPRDLDLAKDIVLDLLGWGVDPEYLVEYLRLKLPKNVAACMHSCNVSGLRSCW